MFSRTLPSGWEALDARLGGGWPVGTLAEMGGHGRTTLALAAVRAAQGRGQPVAWVDGAGVFCPATAGVDLGCLTLVRPAPGTRREAVSRALFATDVLLRSRAFALLVLDLPPGRAPLAAWFRLARLARRADTALLLLHGERRPVGGSAAGLVLRVRLRPPAVPPWADLPPPGLEVAVRRHRAAPGSQRVLLPPPA